MTEKKTAEEILKEHYPIDISEADGLTENILEAMEDYAAQQKSETQQRCPTCKGEGYTNFYDQGEPNLDSKCHQCNGTGKIMQKSEIKMPTKEAIVQYFNNHFNCYADVIIGDYETTETAMTVDAVLKMIEWLRNQITEKK